MNKEDAGRPSKIHLTDDCSEFSYLLALLMVKIVT